MIEGICICTVSEFFLISRTCSVTNASKNSKATTEWKISTSIPCPGCKEGYRTKAPNLNAPARQLHGRGQISKGKTNKPTSSYKPSCSVKFRQLAKDTGNQIPILTNSGGDAVPITLATAPHPPLCQHGHSPDIKVAKLKKLKEASVFHSRGKNLMQKSLARGKRSIPTFSSAAASRSVQLCFKNTAKSRLSHSWRLCTWILTPYGFQLWGKENYGIK